MHHKYIFHLFSADGTPKYCAVVIASDPKEARQYAYTIDNTKYWLNSKYMIITTCRTSLTSRVLALEKVPKYVPPL